MRIGHWLKTYGLWAAMGLLLAVGWQWGSSGSATFEAALRNTDWTPYQNQLDQIPLQLGPWYGEPGVAEALERQAQGGVAVSRTLLYRNRWGSEVLVFVACGPKRKLLSHLPVGCYRAAGYELVGSATEQTLELNSIDQQMPLDTALFCQPESPESSRLRVYWSWLENGTWHFKSQQSVLPEGDAESYRPIVKVYFCIPAGSSNEGELPEGPTPATLLMQEFVPELTRLFS